MSIDIQSTANRLRQAGMPFEQAYAYAEVLGDAFSTTQSHDSNARSLAADHQTTIELIAQKVSLAKSEIEYKLYRDLGIAAIGGMGLVCFALIMSVPGR